MTNPFAILIDVADAVVAELNAGNTAGSFSKTFVATRTYDTDLELEASAASALSVNVAFGVPVIEKATVVRDRIVCPVDIAVRQQVLVSNTTACDALVEFSGELWAYLAGSGTDGFPRVLSAYNTAAWEDPDREHAPWPYVPDILKESNQFVSILHTFYVVHA